MNKQVDHKVEKISSGEPKTSTVDLSSFRTDEKNSRDHTQAGQKALAVSLRELGAGRSIVADKNGVIRAGNGTLEAARDLGYEKAFVVETDGKTLVVVKRNDWTEEQAAAYGLVDNKSAELSGWNKNQLTDTMVAIAHTAENLIPVLEAQGFSTKDLALTLENAKAPVAFDAKQETGLRFSVIVTVDGERAQSDLVQELTDRGLQCKVMIS